MLKKLLLIFIISTTVILTACDTPTNQSISLSHKTIENVDNVAWMRSKLPANTLAYFRIPSLWQMFFEAKADVLHQVQKQDEHVTLINTIKKGVLETYAEFIPQQVQLSLKHIVSDLSTPLEMAALSDTNGSMTPNILLATTFKDMTIQQLNDFFTGLIDQIGPSLKFSSPFDADGKGQLMAAMVPVFATFDDKTGRLLMLAGLSANQVELDNIMSRTGHADELDNIISYENSVDQAGKNLQLWFNVESIYQQNKSFIPPDMMKVIVQLGLDQVEYVWAGAVAKNGKSELIMRVGMPEVGIRQIMPSVDSQMDLLTAGEPKSVWQIAIPSVEQMQRGFDWVLSIGGNGEKAREFVAEMVSEVNAFFDISLTEIFDAYGQKLMIINDDAGTWFAVSIKNRTFHKTVMQKLTKAFDAKNEIRSLAGVDIHHMSYSTRTFEDLLMPDQAGFVLSQLLNFRQSAYYQIEGDYFINAFIPQVLADRANNTNKVNLNQWLTNQQALNWNQAIFAYSKEVNNAPRDIYHFYLSVLTFMGYFTNVEVDLFNFPTTQQLNLPPKGRYGFAMESSIDALTLKLSYEYSFLENVSFVESYLALGVIGIVAAYAIPAYQNYTIRLRVNEKISRMRRIKTMITDHYAQYGIFPGHEKLMVSNLLGENTRGKYSSSYDKETGLLTLQFSEEAPNDLNQNNITVNYEPKTGMITLNFFKHDHVDLSHKNITFTPSIGSDGFISWECDGTVDAKYFNYRCY